MQLVLEVYFIAVDTNFSRTKLYTKTKSASGKPVTCPLANMYVVFVIQGDYCALRSCLWLLSKTSCLTVR